MARLRKQEAAITPEELQTAHFALLRRIEALYIAGVLVSPVVSLSARKVAVLRQRADRAMGESAELERRCGPEAIIEAYKAWADLLSIDGAADDVFERLTEIAKQKRDRFSGRSIIPSTISDELGNEIAL